MTDASSANVFQTGDHVRILPREPQTADPKRIVYYAFFSGLSGSVLKQYPDNNVLLDVDRPSLPSEVLARHEAAEKAMRDKWLGSISEDERERLSEKHKRFALRYTLLVQSSDLVKEDLPARRSKSKSSDDATIASRSGALDFDTAEEAYLDQVRAQKEA